MPFRTGKMGLAWGPGTVGIQFPMYFAVGYTRARILSYLPFAAIVLIAVGGAPLLPHGGADLTPDTAVTIAITAAGMAMLTASALVSCQLFGRRAL